jgi:hypothetical protein
MCTILGIPGCGVSSASSNPIVLWGRVTYNGKPVEDGAVIFMPADRGKSVWGAGHINPDGRFSLSAYLKDTPLEPGRYDIFFRPPGPKLVRSPRRADRTEEEQELKNAEVTQPELAPSGFPIPERFTDQKTSGLSLRFDGRPQRIDLDLRD